MLYIGEVFNLFISFLCVCVDNFVTSVAQNGGVEDESRHPDMKFALDEKTNKKNMM